MSIRFFADCPGIFSAPTDVGGSVGRAAPTPDNEMMEPSSGASVFITPLVDTAKTDVPEGVSRFVQSMMREMRKADCSRDDIILFVGECIILITKEMTPPTADPPTSDSTPFTTRSTIPPEGLRLLAKSALKELKAMGCSYTHMLRFANECLSIVMTPPRSPSTVT